MVLVLFNQPDRRHEQNHQHPLVQRKQEVTGLSIRQDQHIHDL